MSEVIAREFIARDADYLAKRADAMDRIERVAEALAQLESSGIQLPCSRQQLLDAKHLSLYTDHWANVTTQLKMVASSMSDHNQSWAAEQQPGDGSWGPCYSRLAARYDAASEAVNAAVDARHVRASFPLRWTAPVANASGLVTLLDEHRISTIRSTGIDQRDDLGALIGAVTQFAFKPPLAAFINRTDAFATPPLLVIDDAYSAHFTDYLDRWQDTCSGFWGAGYALPSSGDAVQSADLSLTYHIVAYRGGRVQRWPQIIQTLLAMRTAEYPFGWVHRTGKSSSVPTHNSYDVTKLCKFGWPHVPRAAQVAIGDAIGWLVNETLAQEIASTEQGKLVCDMSFYNSLGACYYYAASFLHEAHYFTSTDKPPWWSIDPSLRFADGPRLCRALLGEIARLRLANDEAKAAVERLRGDCHS